MGVSGDVGEAESVCGWSVRVLCLRKEGIKGIRVGESFQL